MEEISPIAAALPDVFSELSLWGIQLWQWLGLLIASGLAAVLGTVVGALALRIVAQVADRTEVEWDDLLLGLIRGPIRLFIALLGMRLLVEPLQLAEAESWIDKLLAVAATGAAGWFSIRMVRFIAAMLEQRATRSTDEAEGDPDARGARTQIVLLRRIASIVVGFVAAALMLLQFDVVRSVGMSLLASAGIAGIVLGLAAQKSISGLLAGIQLSITQPVRIGDTVIVEGEWGWIEEINLTYVVVKVWDERRLVVPMTAFLDKPFQNWTKVSPELLGTIFFHADYGLPIDAVREELGRILEGNEKWDERAKGVLVTDVTERTVQVRAMVSAKNSGELWDLRCEVREKLVAWLREYEGGRYLPRARVDANEQTARKLAPAGS